MNLNPAIQTAKYAKYAKTEQVRQRLFLTCRVNDPLVPSITHFVYFVVLTAFSRFMVELFCLTCYTLAVNCPRVKTGNSERQHDDQWMPLELGEIVGPPAICLRLNGELTARILPLAS
ncbi:MAG: hypothetical protein AAB676_20015 [Verrucomicrobiota bacterium]